MKQSRQGKWSEQEEKNGETTDSKKENRNKQHNAFIALLRRILISRTIQQ